MVWLNVVLLVYAILNIFLGIVAYVRDHEIMSIIGGGTIAVLVLASLVWSKFNPRAGRILALVAAAAEMGKFAQKTFTQNELYPSGLLFSTSLIVVLCLGAGHMTGMKARKAREAAEKQSSK